MNQSLTLLKIMVGTNLGPSVEIRVSYCASNVNARPLSPLTQFCISSQIKPF